MLHIGRTEKKMETTIQGLGVIHRDSGKRIWKRLLGLRRCRVVYVGVLES